MYRGQINGETGYITLLFLIEHQSTPDKQTAFRFLEYTTHLMRNHISAGNDNLPIVYLLCIYHGSVSPYPYFTDLYELFMSPEFARQFMFKPYQLLDLTTHSIDAIDHDGLAATMEMLLKAHQAKKELKSMLGHIVGTGMLQALIQQTTDPYLQYVLYYWMELNEQNNDVTAEEMVELLKKALPDKREQILTFREQLQQQGMLLDTYEAKREDARKLLAEGVNHAF